MDFKNDAGDEAALRRIFEHWFAATAKGDVDGVMHGIAQDVISYEHDAPLQYRGAAAVREVCEKGMALSGGGSGWDVPESTFLIRDDLAVQWGLNRMHFVAEDGKPAESWSRGTRVFRKTGDAWEMVHQHVSFPYDPETGQARTDLTPASKAEPSKTQSSDEAEVRQTIERWVKAVQARDLAAVTAAHTSDVVMFDVPLPVAVRGLEAYKATWPPFFEWQRKEEGTFEIVSLDVTAGDQVAFATAVLRCGSKKELSVDDTPKLRLSVGLRKEGGRWLIAHEHHSFPLESP